jgi:TonB family protein
MRQNTWAKCFGGALLLFFGGSGLAWPLPTAAQTKVPPLSEMQPGVTILTPIEGVDFQSYTNRLVSRLKRTWYAVMPEPALQGKKGIVVLTFHIQRDGKIPSPDPTLERTSRSEDLDVAAMKAVHDAAPFDPLPEAFHGPEIQLRLVFFYNIPVPKDTIHPPDTHRDPPTNPSAPPASPPVLPPPPAAAESSTSPLRGMQTGVTILTPHPGVDFDSYINRLLATVKRKWYAVMPESAMTGEKGIVILTFHIQRDGKIPDADLPVVRTSGSEELDDAAMKAVHTSAPFEALPEAFHGPNIQVRFVFFYNGARPKARLVPIVQSSPAARICYVDRTKD